MVESSEGESVCFNTLTYLRKTREIMIAIATTALRILFVFVVRGNPEMKNSLKRFLKNQHLSLFVR